jgi:putative ABC transport system permease protein
MSKGQMPIWRKLRDGLHLRALAAKLRRLFGDRRAGRELDDEIEMHLRLLTERYVRQGMSEADAACAARRQFGNITLLREANHEMRGIRFIETLFQDLRYGMWMLRRNPGFTFIAVLTLALGIGANTAIFSVVNAVLLKPLPYNDPQRLVWLEVSAIWQDGAKVSKLEGPPSISDYLHLQEESKAFDHLVAFSSGRRIYLTGRGEPERVDSVWATANLFPALGGTPQLGRAFTLEEDRLGGARVAILSHALWQRRFGGDPAIIGQSLMLGGESRQVIGVMPPGFKFIRNADVWLPLAIDVQKKSTDQKNIHIDNIFGRIRSGVSVEHARSELESILRRIRNSEEGTEVPGDQERPPDLLQVRVTPLGERLVGHLRHRLLVLFGAVAFVLLIACANVANLMLARTRVRQKEMAIRAAMGAGRARLVRQMLTESLLLALLGGMAGLFLALLSVKALVAFIPEDLAQIRESGIDGVALGFTFIASLLTGVVAGIIPALQASRVDLNESLKEGARGAVFSKRKGAQRVSPALLVGELALTLALLAGAGLLIKSFMRARAVEPGYNPKNLLTMMIPLNFAKYPQGSARQRFFRDLLTRIKSIPGVKDAAIGPLPLTGMRRITRRPPEPNSQGRGIELNDVSPHYFHTMGIELRAGRSLTDRDNEDTPPVIVINESLAHYHFPGEDPIGKPLHNMGTIIGVVADVKRFGLEAETQSESYHSYLQCKMYEEQELVVRTAGDPLKWAPAVRQQVWAIDADQPVESVMSMEQRLTESVAPRRFQMLLFGVFAVVALVIATVGIYGVISYAVSQRTHEIGIRMALGAQTSDVLRMVIWRGMCLALIGVALGLAAALALTRVIKSMLFNVSETDPATFALIAFLLVGVALIASYIPARRATKVDPLQALRHE